MAERSRSRSQEKEKEAPKPQGPPALKPGTIALTVPAKFDQNEIQKKRALLWNSKSTAQIDEKKQIWNKVQGDKNEKLRFMKLLGVKEVNLGPKQLDTPDTERLRVI